MSTPADGPTQITFTERGEAALDALAAALTARIAAETRQDPEAIAVVLDEVLRADVEDLAAAVTATDAHSAAAQAAEGPGLAFGQHRALDDDGPSPDAESEAVTRSGRHVDHHDTAVYHRAYPQGPRRSGPGR